MLAAWAAADEGTGCHGGWCGKCLVSARRRELLEAMVVCDCSLGRATCALEVAKVWEESWLPGDLDEVDVDEDEGQG